MKCKSKKTTLIKYRSTTPKPDQIEVFKRYVQVHVMPSAQNDCPVSGSDYVDQLAEVTDEKSGFAFYARLANADNAALIRAVIYFMDCLDNFYCFGDAILDELERRQG
jgi:hypothetical protein